MVNVKTSISGISFVLYLRISTAKTGGVDSNGIHAQERDIDIFLSGQHEPVVLQKFIEVESGANNERPQLKKAIRLCKKTNSHLLVQKVDRLSRDVECIAKLVKDKNLTLRVANLPNADNFQIHLFAALGQAEREFISQRTKSAMAVAKSQGAVFGNPRITQMNQTRKRTAKKFANGLSHIIIPLRQKGLTYQEISNTINQMGIKTPKGMEFHPTQVKRILDRSVA